jgi:hypothetical protein
MFDEQIDQEPDLPEIIEEVFEEEDSVDENDDGTKDGLVASVREERALKKDEIKSLRTQVLTIREKLADKTAKIEVIKDTLK